MQQRVDLNCDLGELEGASGLERELGLLAIVSSINLACGLHAGDPQRIRRLARAAGQAGVAIGAHPGYPDRAGFGRVELNLPRDEIRDWVLYQLGALGGLVRAEGQRLNHVKPHGALYNRAFRDRSVAEAIVEAVIQCEPDCWLVGAAGSELLAAGNRAGLATASEVFADRGYAADGSLLPRGSSGALLVDPKEAAERVCRIVREKSVPLPDGSRLAVVVDTICVHGDHPAAQELALRTAAALRAEGIELGPLRRCSRFPGTSGRGSLSQG
jgi:UPF0271 protein